MFFLVYFRFNTDNDFNGHHLTVYQVDEINFLDCNTSDGKRLRHDNHTELRILNEDVSLSSSRFFIGKYVNLTFLTKQ